MIFYSIVVLALFLSHYGEPAPFYTQKSESKFPPPESSQNGHEKIGLEPQLKPSNQPEFQRKTDIELKIQMANDRSFQSTQKLMKDVSEIGERINEGDQSEETEIGNIDLETVKSAWNNLDLEEPFPTNESSVVETVIPLPPITNKDILQVQRSLQKLDVTATISPPMTLPSGNPSSSALPENINDDFSQLSHDIVPMKEVISLETTVIPTVSEATPLALGTTETIITHATPVPSATMSTLSNLETSTADTIPTFSSLKKTEFNFESSEELESTEEEFSSASTTITSEVTQQSTQRVDILTTKIPEILLPTEPSTTSSIVSKDIKEPESSVSQKPDSGSISSSTTLVSSTSPIIPSSTVRSTSPRRRPQSAYRLIPASPSEPTNTPKEQSILKTFFTGVSCVMKHCPSATSSKSKTVTAPSVSKFAEDHRFAQDRRFARDHGSTHPTNAPCSCEKKKHNNTKSTIPSASTNVTDMNNVHS